MVSGTYHKDSHHVTASLLTVLSAIQTVHLHLLLAANWLELRAGLRADTATPAKYAFNP